MLGKRAWIFSIAITNIKLIGTMIAGSTESFTVLNLHVLGENRGERGNVGSSECLQFAHLEKIEGKEYDKE